MGAADIVLRRLADGEIVIIDGGMGSQLQAEGVPMDEVAWSARANLDQPDVVQRVHEAYIRAGAEVIIANTFAASRAALEPAGLGDHVAEANRNAVGAALRAQLRRDPPGGGGRVDFVVLPAAMDGGGAGPPAGRPHRGSPPGLADYREQARLLAAARTDRSGDDRGSGYGRAAMQAAAETGLPVWLGISAARRQDGTLETFADLGGGDTFEDLLSALADPALAAVTVMHSDPEVIPDAIQAIRHHFAGPIGAYAENGDWVPPNWVFNGLTPGEYLHQATAWADGGAQLVGGCCGTGPGHIRVLADTLAGRRIPPGQGT